MKMSGMNKDIFQNEIINQPLQMAKFNAFSLSKIIIIDVLANVLMRVNCVKEDHSAPTNWT